MQPNNETPQTVDAIAALAREGQYPKLGLINTAGLGPGLPPEVPVLLQPGRDPKAIGLGGLVEAYRQAPARRKGTAKVTTLAAFIDLTNRHKDENSAVFAMTALPHPKLTTVVDYHGKDGSPRHAGHRVEYAFPITAELRAWLDRNGKPMEQLEFAQFLEEHAAELASPLDAERIDYERLFKERFSTPNELLDLSRSLEIFVGAKVKRQERLQTGERVVEFTMEHLNGAGEKVDIPGIFMVSVQAFVDGDPVRIPARLRYRTKAGEISWFYQLYRPEFWLRAQIQTDLLKVAEQTGLPTFEGEPEAAG